MKRMLAGVLLICLAAAILCGCGGAASEGKEETAGQPAASDRKTPMTQDRFEQILQSRGYEPIRIAEDDLDNFAFCDTADREYIPTAVSGMEASGLECFYFSFADAEGAESWAEENCRGVDEEAQIRRESGSNWERITARNDEFDSWSILRVENVVLITNTYSDEDAMQRGEELFAALEAG